MHVKSMCATICTTQHVSWSVPKFLASTSLPRATPQTVMIYFLEYCLRARAAANLVGTCYGSDERGGSVCTETIINNQHCSNNTDVRRGSGWHLMQRIQPLTQG